VDPDPDIDPRINAADPDPAIFVIDLLGTNKKLILKDSLSALLITF
jgi:hypothetical protein